MKRKYIIRSFFIFFLIMIIFVVITYKILNSGNNINKSDDNDILNIKSYEAIVEVEVYSNKNTNKYILKQEYSEPNIFKQEVLEPENIKGLTTTFNGEQLVIENKTLSLRKTYDNYSYIYGNSLSLISFIEEYKETDEKKEEEQDEEKVITIKLKESTNKYEKYKKIYINKETNLPTKMEILDINQNRTVYILYKEIEINKTTKEEILED